MSATAGPSHMEHEIRLVLVVSGWPLRSPLECRAGSIDD